MAESTYKLSEHPISALESAREYGGLVLRVVLDMQFSQFKSQEAPAFRVLLSEGGNEPKGVGKVINSLVKPLIETFFVKYFGEGHFLNIDNAYVTISVSDMGNGDRRVTVFMPNPASGGKGSPGGIQNISEQKGLFFDLITRESSGNYELVSGQAGFNDGNSAQPGKHRVVYDISKSTKDAKNN